MNTPEKLNKQGQQYIVDLAHAASDLWKRMMEDLGLPPDSKFVEANFLASSKYHKFYDIAQTRYWQAKQEYAVGGYVGLKIGQR